VSVDVVPVGVASDEGGAVVPVLGSGWSGRGWCQKWKGSNWKGSNDLQNGRCAPTAAPTPTPATAITATRTAGTSRIAERRRRTSCRSGLPRPLSVGASGTGGAHGAATARETEAVHGSESDAETGRTQGSGSTAGTGAFHGSESTGAVRAVPDCCWCSAPDEAFAELFFDRLVRNRSPNPNARRSATTRRFRDLSS
jgi:hypothetical protein